MELATFMVNEDGVPYAFYPNASVSVFAELVQFPNDAAVVCVVDSPNYNRLRAEMEEW